MNNDMECIWLIRVGIAVAVIGVLAACAAGCKTSYGLGGDLMDLSRPFVEHRDGEDT